MTPAEENAHALALLAVANRHAESYWSRFRAAALVAPIFVALDPDEATAVYGNGFWFRTPEHVPEYVRPSFDVSEALPVEDDYSEESYP